MQIANIYKYNSRPAGRPREVKKEKKRLYYNRRTKVYYKLIEFK